MKITRPSPSMAVACTALFVALGGSAGAATYVIKSSSQVKNNTLSGLDIKNRSIKSGDIAKGAITSTNIKKGTIGAAQLSPSAMSTAVPGVATANEVVRRSSPVLPKGPHVIATMAALPAGTYAIFAKSTVGVDESDAGLLEILKNNKTQSAECVLDTAGDQDKARGTVASVASKAPATLNMQITRTLTAPTNITISCNVPDVSWLTNDTSIVALKLSGTSRKDVDS